MVSAQVLKNAGTNCQISTTVFAAGGGTDIPSGATTTGYWSSAATWGDVYGVFATGASFPGPASVDFLSVGAATSCRWANISIREILDPGYLDSAGAVAGGPVVPPGNIFKHTEYSATSLLGNNWNDATPWDNNTNYFSETIAVPDTGYVVKARAKVCVGVYTDDTTPTIGNAYMLMARLMQNTTEVDRAVVSFGEGFAGSFGLDTLNLEAIDLSPTPGVSTAAANTYHVQLNMVCADLAGGSQGTTCGWGSVVAAYLNPSATLTGSFMDGYFGTNQAGANDGTDGACASGKGSWLTLEAVRVD